MINKNFRILNFIFGVLIGFLLYKTFCVYGPSKNKCYYKFNQINYFKKYKVHIHHWIIHLILLYFNFFDVNSKLYYLYIGLNIGGILHGILMYKNWYIIFK